MAAPSTYVSRVRASARIAKKALQELIDLRSEGIRLGGVSYVSPYFTANPDLDLSQSGFVAGLAAIDSIDTLLKTNSNELWADLDALAD